MLYTILDEAEIFYSAQKTNYSYKKVANCVLEGVKYNQCILLNRVISTDLRDYLKPEYQIGQKLTLPSDEM